MTAQMRAARAVLVVGISIAAYHYSLGTLLRGLSSAGPLAYLGLVPFVALLVSTLRAAQPHEEADIHDRYLDWIVGFPLLVSAVVIVTVLPLRLSTYFWLWRLDLLSMPLFVAGAIALMFGTRALWRFKPGIALLLLGWPTPYLLVPRHTLDAVAHSTLNTLEQVTATLGVAQAVGGRDDSLFLIASQGRDFVLSVGLPSGAVNGVLSFLIVGLALLPLVTGPLIGRIAWLVIGATVIWLLEMARIVAVLVVSHIGGQQIALNPVLGLVVFNLGVLAMVAALPLLRLRIDTPRFTQWPIRRSGGAMGRQLWMPLVALVAAGAMAGSANQGLRRFELLSTPLGQPLVTQSAVSSHQIPGWTAKKTASFSWIRAYLGQNARWERYEYSSLSHEAITVDVFTSAERNMFPLYDLDAAYHLHRYHLVTDIPVDLPGGIVGKSVFYRAGSSPVSWSGVYWEWAVETPDGVGYERVVTFVDRDRGAPVTHTALVDFSRRLILASVQRTV